MKTKDRILLASLTLFNEQGEPNVTTLQIADELNISPGNLYYHFKNKAEIVDGLFNQFEARINDLLDVPETILGVEDQWLFLHLLFEAIAQYRFLYQDLVNVLGRYERIKPRFKRILNKKLQASRTICRGMKQQGILLATDVLDQFRYGAQRADWAHYGPQPRYLSGTGTGGAVSSGRRPPPAHGGRESLYRLIVQWEWRA